MGVYIAKNGDDYSQLNGTLLRIRLIPIQWNMSLKPSPLLTNSLCSKTNVSSRITLSFSEFRYFWISWAGHHVQVGRGAKQGQETFLSWVVPPNRQFKVNSMAVATSRQTKGQWEFAEIMGEYMQMLNLR